MSDPPEDPAKQDTLPHSGFLGKQRPRLGGNSLSEWLDLGAKLAIPLVVLAATVGFGWWQSHLADQQHQSDRRLAALQHQSDQQIALSQERATILETYIGDMQALLLNHGLRVSKPDDEVREVAREYTLTTLRRLDSQRNAVVLQFLRDARLVGVQDAVINLSNADLSGDDLSGAQLTGVDLIGADLRNAILNDSSLSSATMYGANLSGADLKGADLDGAYLSYANLTRADLNGAQLSNVTLTGAFMGGASLNHAIMTGAHLNGAILTDAQLNGAMLSTATLNGSILTGADLSRADLSYADLSHATLNGSILSDATLTGADLIDTSALTQPQLDSVYSCTPHQVWLATGLTCHHRVSITLTYWYTESPAEAHVIRTLIKHFDQQNPGIRIHAVNMPYFQAQAAFVTATEAGGAPDVLRCDVGWVTQFASQGYLLSLDVSQSDLSDYRNAPFGKRPLGYDMYNGIVYGLPQVTDFLALLYNRHELAMAGITSAPATMAAFEADAVRLVQSKAAKHGFETSGTSYYALPFLYAFGGGMIDQHNKILVNSQGSVNGLEFLLKLQNIDKVMPTSVDFSTGYTNMVDDFMSGRTAMVFDGPYEVKNILSGLSFKGDPGNLGIARIPIGPAGEPDSPQGGQSYVISADTAHPVQAYKFILFMNSKASQVAIAKANDTLPTRQSAYEDRVVSDPVIKAFLAIRRTAVPRPVIPQGGHLFDAFDPEIGAALDGTESPMNALNAVADAWKQLLTGP